MRGQSKGKKIGNVITAIILALALLSAAPLAAFSSFSVKALQIPSQYGIIKETFEKDIIAPGQGQVIIHIQDAHCNYEAQKNMAQILDHLVKEYGLKLVMVEGGSGNVGLSYLRSYADKKERQRIADKYLGLGQISGEEYLDITSDYNLELYGIEDQELYDAHLSVFQDIDAIKEEGLKYIGDTLRVVEALKPYIYSPQLSDLEKKKNGYEDKEISLAEYCLYLNDAAMMQRLKFEDYYNISAFSSTAQFEKDVDFKSAESERNAFIRELGGLLDEKSLEELLQKSQDFKAEKIGPYEYYSFLSDISHGKLDLGRNYPHLNSYIRYIKVSKDTDTADILKEIDAVSEKLRASYAINDDQRGLSGIARALEILAMILNLELTPDGYEYFQAHRLEFLSASWAAFLNERCRRYGLSFNPMPSAVIDDNIGQLEEFYQLGIKREKAFIGNVAKKMNESGEKIAVLITGGFHTPGISRMLKENGYSYAIMAPVITQKGDPNIYLSVLKGQKGLADMIESR